MECRGNPALPLAAVPAAAATVPGGTRDRLSRLPDHLLVCILLKLRTKQAVETSALCRQWRSVWAQLPVLRFDGVDSSVPARALAAYRAHGEGDIRRLTVSPNQASAQHAAAWLPLAAPILSGRLFLDNSCTVSPETLHLFLEEAVAESGAFVELPCFKKATEIFLDLGFLGLALPPAGIFGALRVMWLEHFWFGAQLSISDSMFPSLQQLTIRRVRGLVVLTLDSKSLLYLHLSVLLEFRRLEILAPGLKKLEVNRCFDVPGPVAASIAAERLEVLRWEVPCVPELREMPRLRVLGAPPISTLWSEDICAEFLNCFPAVDHLELWISLGMQYLCLPGCLCDNEPEIWGAKVVPIRDLRKVGIVNFHGAPREVYLVEQLVLRAPKLEILRITSKVEDPSLDVIGRVCHLLIVHFRDEPSCMYTSAFVVSRMDLLLSAIMQISLR